MPRPSFQPLPHYTVDQWLQRSWQRPTDGRRYRVELSQNLFGEWVLIREWWGVASKRRGSKKQGVNTYAEGVECLEAVAKRRMQRGYVVTEIS
ncbi:MAG: hypothetical protein AAF827_12425 [Cyanobacteria bacterium P01_D01_bin.6]